jgi:hypothetical protein
LHVNDLPAGQPVRRRGCGRGFAEGDEKEKANIPPNTNELDRHGNNSPPYAYLRSYANGK